MAATDLDHHHAVELAEEAGRLLVELRAGIGTSLTVQAAKDEGDRRSHQLLMTRLRQRCPHDAVLSEEGVDDLTRTGVERVWIVDPLDGTREFGEPPRVDWAVHVALAIGGEAVVGAVALPAQGLVLSTARPVVPPPAADPMRPRVVVSRTRAPEGALGILVDELRATVVPMGSAGAKTAAVVRGDADVYFHSGGQYEWDSAAPAAVAAGAGLHVSRADGSPLRYNQPDPWLPDLVVCRRELAERVLAALRQG